jgi:hypothetical protein
MPPEDYDHREFGSPGGPHEDDGDWCYTRDESDAVIDLLGTMENVTGLPDDVKQMLAVWREDLERWIAMAEEAGVEPSNDPADKYDE